MVINNTQDGIILNKIIAETIFSHHHHSVIKTNDNMIIDAMIAMNRVSVIKATVTEILIPTTKVVHHAGGCNLIEVHHVISRGGSGRDSNLQPTQGLRAIMTSRA